MKALEKNCAITSATDSRESWTPWPMAEIPGYDDVLAAKKRIAPFAVRTPLVESPILGDRIGGRVFLKLEFLQRTGSFKFRGALNRILLIPEPDRAKGVV